MRHSELEEGIHVLDSNGNVVGSSRIAAKHVRGRRSPLLRGTVMAFGIWLVPVALLGHERNGTDARLHSLQGGPGLTDGSAHSCVTGNAGLS